MKLSYPISSNSSELLEATSFRALALVTLGNGGMLKIFAQCSKTFSKREFNFVEKMISQTWFPVSEVEYILPDLHSC